MTPTDADLAKGREIVEACQGSVSCDCGYGDAICPHAGRARTVAAIAAALAEAREGAEAERDEAKHEQYLDRCCGDNIQAEVATPQEVEAAAREVIAGFESLTYVRFQNGRAFADALDGLRAALAKVPR